MANLNLDYYSGKDEYSDGEIELEMLRIAKEKINIEDMDYQKLKFPIVYHFSHIRENILNWYPFKENARVLEIGSGCGAITGLLCKKLKYVTSIELSKLRALINYYRNQDNDNLEIIVGNFNDIQLQDKYDYIVLNGVFEYAINFTNSDNPYSFFLEAITDKLKDDGRILIAIENRLGLKYFAGACEEHTGNIFLGLNEYKNNNNVRTFSKSELVHILEECNLNFYNFYYPFPDYKFPNEIYTEETFEKNGYGRPYYSLNSKRIKLFDETKVSKSLTQEKVMSSFANSFLIEASKNPYQSSDIVYAKINNDRHNNFRLSTIIQGNKQNRVVLKSPLNEQTSKHITIMLQNSKVFHSKKYESLIGEYIDNQLIYPYLEDNSLDKTIEQLISKKNSKEILRILNFMYDTFFEESKIADDYCTDEFAEVFGEVRINRELPCVKPANIDLICDNVYVENNKFIVIDCEWVFNFNIPCQFIIWRTINELYYKHSTLVDIISESELLENFGVDNDLSLTFREWANYFARKYVESYRLELIAEKNYNIDMDNIYRTIDEETTLCSKIYYNLGNGFNEDDIIVKKAELKDNNFIIEFTFDHIEKIKDLRWDPIELKPCICSIYAIESNTNLNIKPLNALKYNETTATFVTLDPIYLFEGDFSKLKYLKIRGRIEYLSIETIIELFNKLTRSENSLVTQLKDKQYKIEQLEKDFKLQIEDLNNRLNGNKKTIEDLSDKMANKELMIKELQDVIEKCNNNYYNMESELKIIIYDKERESLELNSKLQAIYNSKSWKILCTLSKLKNSAVQLIKKDK